MKPEMKLAALVLSLFFAVNVYAIPPQQTDFSKINFVGLQVLSPKNENAFPWSLKPFVNGWDDLYKKLEEVAGVKIASPIFYLNEKTSFKNIFVFIGKSPDGAYQFVNVYYTMSGSMYPANMKIMNVEHDHLDVAQGIPNEQPKDYYKVVATQLFP